MKETIEGDQSISPEGFEEQKYREWQAAVEEEEQIRRDIERVFAEISDRSEAEKIVLAEYAPQMDVAMKKSAELFQEWFKAVRQSRQSEEGE